MNNGNFLSQGDCCPIESAFLSESSEDKNFSSDDSTKAFKIVGDEGKSYFR